MITKYTIALDRLELMLTESTESATDSTNLTNFLDTTSINAFTQPAINIHTITEENAKDKYQTNSISLYKSVECKGHYKLHYEIEIDGIELGYIKLLPTKPRPFFNGKPLIYFSISKALLYSSWLPLVIKFLDEFNLTINNIIKYEIALDTNEDANQLLLDNFFDTSKWFISRNNIKTNILEVSTLYRDGKSDSSFYIGERGNLQIAFYNKTLKGHASFIKEYHQANGLDINQPIYRIEVRAPRKALKTYLTIYKDSNSEEISKATWLKLNDYDKSQYTKETKHRYRNITLEELADTKELLALFKLDFEKLCDFRLKDKAKKEKCTKIKLIDLQQVNTYIITETNKPSMKQDVNLQKRLIKNCLENYKIEKNAADWQRAVNLSLDYNLTDYFDTQLTKIRVKQPKPIANNYNTSNPLLILE